jgi:cytolysin-activating lysine-acyltransferase
MSKVTAKQSGKKEVGKKAKSNGAAPNGAHAPAGPIGNQTKITPEVGAKLSELRNRIQSSVGQVVLAMINLPRYRNQTLGDLTHLVLEPLLRDRLAIATARPKDGGEAESNIGENLAGIAIWATVNDAGDAKIREQIKDGAFPVRLSSEEWVSGDTLWLLDVIAPNRKLATSVLANFSQVAQDKPVNIHPIVARSVEPELLEKMKVKNAGEPSV